MPTERKVQQVADLEERLGRTVIAIGLDYRGLSVGQMRALRVALRAQEPSMELRVVKNTLLARAAVNAGKPGVREISHQATALVLGYEDEVGPPKALRKYLRDSRLEIPIHGGYLDGDVLSADQVDQLASVPSRLELMAKIAGGLNSPITGIAGGINALLRELAAIIEARAEQLDTGETDTGNADTAAGSPPPEPDAPADANPDAEASAGANTDADAAPAAAETQNPQTEECQDGCRTRGGRQQCLRLRKRSS